MTNTAQGASAPTIETNTHAFCSINPAGQMLFAVNDGVPLVEALEMAQCYLSAARAITAQTADSLDSGEAFGAHYLVEMAAAVLDSAVSSAYKEARMNSRVHPETSLNEEEKCN